MPVRHCYIDCMEILRHNEYLNLVSAQAQAQFSSECQGTIRLRRGVRLTTSSAVITDSATSCYWSVWFWRHPISSKFLMSPYDHGKYESRTKNWARDMATGRERSEKKAVWGVWQGQGRRWNERSLVAAKRGEDYGLGDNRLEESQLYHLTSARCRHCTSNIETPNQPCFANRWKIAKAQTWMLLNYRRSSSFAMSIKFVVVVVKSLRHQWPRRSRHFQAPDNWLFEKYPRSVTSNPWNFLNPMKFECQFTKSWEAQFGQNEDILMWS